jgi:hypothetical protein
MKKVGKKYFNGKKMRLFSYKEVVCDAEGWVKAEDFLPPDYDLVSVKIGDTTISGWHTGHYWDGLKLRFNEDVIYWKRREEEEEEEEEE